MFKDSSDLNTTNKSTLSLNIAAYKNPIASDLFRNENVEGLRKKEFGSIKTSKQCFTGPFKFQNPFEFPRQQDGDQKNEPEVKQFKATQKLTDQERSQTSQQSAPAPAPAATSQVGTSPGLKSDQQELPPEREKLVTRRPGFSYQLVTIQHQRGCKFGLGIKHYQNKVIVSRVDDE
uniref:Uncharacterized protein n=1 Tax=Panagrolaimus davidi TaxID=227884 RepID=A0A914QAI3_9BILA